MCRRDRHYPESVLAEKLESWENALPECIKLAYLPKLGIIRLRLTGRGQNREEVDVYKRQVKMSFENSEYASWKRDDIDKLERTGVETVFVIEVEKQNQEVDLYYSADGTLIKSIVDTDDDNSEHLPVQLTEAMKNFINEKYPNARIMEVDVEDDRNDWDFGFTEVDIIHNGISKDVLFNQTGNWYSTSWEIRQNELPEAVNNTLNNQYGEYRFDEAEYIEKADGSIYYRIELEKGDVDKVVNIGENGTVDVYKRQV